MSVRWEVLTVLRPYLYILHKPALRSLPLHAVQLLQGDLYRLVVHKSPHAIIGLHLSGTESRVANRTICRIAGLESPEIPQREAKNRAESQYKVESWKTDSESPSHPISA